MHKWSLQLKSRDRISQSLLHSLQMLVGISENLFAEDITKKTYFEESFYDHVQLISMRQLILKLNSKESLHSIIASTTYLAPDMSLIDVRRFVVFDP
jgi:hypothetical protein